MNLSDIFEADQPPRRLLATPRFIRNYQAFTEKYSELPNRVREFLVFRQTARPDQPFNNKDGAMEGFRNLRRCHLVHGKALILYVLGSAVELVDCVEHDQIEGRNAILGLRQFVDTLTPSSFKEFPLPSPPPTKQSKRASRDLTAIEREKLVSLFSWWQREDPSVIERIANDTPEGLEEFMQWARIVVGAEDGSLDRSIRRAFNGHSIPKLASMFLKKK